MRRRAYLAGLGAGLGGLAGCAGRAGPRASTPTATTDPTSTATPTPVSIPGDVELPLDESALRRGAPKDGIAAITDPAFGPDWEGSSVDASLGSSDRVIGVEREGAARAYPLRILDYHEVVNDDFAGPLLVTFCPLCGSGVTAERRVNGQETVFGVSGLLWRSDLVMYDRLTESLWSQILGRAVRGPRTGERLSLLPSQLTTWDDWRDSHPDTAVLLPPPASGTIVDRQPGNYGRDPYPGYEESSRIGIGYNDFEDDRLHPKTQVIGVTDGETARAYPLAAVLEAGVVNDRVGDRPVVVAARSGGTLVAYERTVDGSTLDFERADERHLAAGGSRWDLVTGRAVDGPYDGQELTPANDRTTMFWFAWLDFHPQTSVYGT